MKKRMNTAPAVEAMQGLCEEAVRAMRACNGLWEIVKRDRERMRPQESPERDA